MAPALVPRNGRPGPCAQGFDQRPDNQRLHHAYLFTGTRGVGKTTIARIIAKCLNCETGITSTPCGTCSVCREIDEGRFVDLIEIDAASRTKVEDTRELLDNVQYAPSRGRFKVYLIDEVHMLSTHSFNALLKTLEEPPPYVKFILATTDPQKLPATILSRCLQFSLKNMSPERVVEHLSHVLAAENVPFEEDALWLLGRAADGSMRDAMSLTDQAIAFGEGKVLAADVRAMLGTLDHGQVYGVLQALLEGDARALLEAVRNLAEQGPDWNGVLAEMLNVLHRVAIAQALPEAVDNGQGDRDRVLALASALPAEDVQFYYQMGLIGRRDLPLAPDPRGGFEMVLLRMLAFRPADAEDAPKPVLKPVGISQATADPAKPVAAATPVVEPPVASVPEQSETPAQAAVAAEPAAVPPVEPPSAVVDPVPAPEPERQVEVAAPEPDVVVEDVIDLPWEVPSRHLRPTSRPRRRLSLFRCPVRAQAMTSRLSIRQPTARQAWTATTNRRSMRITTRLTAIRQVSATGRIGRACARSRAGEGAGASASGQAGHGLGSAMAGIIPTVACLRYDRQHRRKLYADCR